MRYFQRTLVGLIFVAITHLAFAQAGDFETRKGVEYATHDGAKLAGDLYLPKAAGPHPAIVAIHGGGRPASGARPHPGRRVADGRALGLPVRGTVSREPRLWRLRHQLPPLEAGTEDVSRGPARRARRHPVPQRQSERAAH